MIKVPKFWHRFRLAIARWIPYPVEGVGFHIPQLTSPGHTPESEQEPSGELPMVLTVEGRVGTVYLSESIWRAIGETAGWH